MIVSRKVLVAAAVVAALGLGLVDAPAAKASNLDDGFLKGGTAAKIRNYLQEQGYKNVGILRFEVKKGNAMPSMSVGKMNTLVATRLENALIHVNDAEKPIGITRSAGTQAASKDNTANWHTTAGRESLFQHQYKLAWGSTAVMVDAFLTGTVEISPNFKETKVVVKVFDKKNTELRVIGTSFTVKTDRDALREMGEGFVIAKRSLKSFAEKGSLTDAEVDMDVAGQVESSNDIAKKLAELKEYLDFQIMVEDAPAGISTESDHAFIDTPSPDQKVEIKVTAKERQLGLLLKVNGKNTLNNETDARDPMESSWWVLEPGKEYTIRGFYKDGKVNLFKVVGEAEADKSELGDNQEKHGIISFEVFTTGGGGGTGEPKIVSRKTANLAKLTGRSTSLKGLQGNIRGTMNKLAKRSVYLVGGGEQAVPLESAEFQGVWVGGCDIYYRPK